MKKRHETYRKQNQSGRHKSNCINNIKHDLIKQSQIKAEIVRLNKQTRSNNVLPIARHFRFKDTKRLKVKRCKERHKIQTVAIDSCSSYSNITHKSIHQENITTIDTYVPNNQAPK